MSNVETFINIRKKLNNLNINFRKKVEKVRKSKKVRKVRKRSDNYIFENIHKEKNCQRRIIYNL